MLNRMETKTDFLQTEAAIHDVRKEFSGTHFPVIAGPCSIESLEQFGEVAKKIRSFGGRWIRGGIWKMRTRPEAFQGLGESSFDFVQQVLKEHNLKLVTEVTDPRQIEQVMPFVSMFQVGARNMYNYALLKELALMKKPVLLKRSFTALVEEWLKASEYLLRGGLEQIILCERGIRTFETSSRFTFDLNSALIAKKRSGLPVIIDPSHAVGLSEFVTPISLAAAAAGCDGLIVEVHNNPKVALSDADQALSLTEYEQLVEKLDAVLKAVGRQRTVGGK